MRRRACDAIRLADAGGTPEASILALWSAVEGILRKTAEAAAIPVERLPVARVISQLYSMGELTLEQHDRLKDALAVRKLLIHGYEATGEDVAGASRHLVNVLGELLHVSMERAA